MTPQLAHDHLPTNFVRRLTAMLASDPRVEGFWLEGETKAIEWPPYATLDLHFSIPEPDLLSVRAELRGWFDKHDAITDFSLQEAPLQGFAGTARLSDGTPLRFRLERSSQIAKVPRRVVNVLLDRSGGLLIPSLSFAP